VQYISYLDIETTGLSPFTEDITVIGLYRQNDRDVIQLIGEDISPLEVIRILKGTETLYTYNGSRFDLPFIREKLGINLNEYCEHKDLMYACWKKNLYGGLKAVEQKLGIKRKLMDVDGWIAVQLWKNYKNYGDEESLKKLLQYNREDVLNLKTLHKKLYL
jgi:hypothetical protein